jgi:hypothetical protein
MILPWPKRPSKYLFIHRPQHWHEQTVDGQFSDNLETLYTAVDMIANEGRRLVTAKNIVFDTVRVEPTLYFNRHANGEDWWMLSPHRNISTYTIFLIDSTGIHRRDTFEMGIPDNGWPRGGDQGLFNPAGDQFYRYNSRDGIQLFDFDRETGALSNFRRVEMEIFDQPTGNNTLGGMGVSPSRQYAYVRTGFKVFQYDLWADDIRGSRILVGVVENYQNLPSIFRPTAISFQLGPDCRLYSFTNVGDEHHVAHRPDERGLACGWEQGWLKLPFPVFRDQIYYPNFRLGAVGKEGSPCANPITTATDATEATGWPVRIYPNPATAEVTIELPDVALGVSARWELYDASGRSVRTETLRGREAIIVEREMLYLPEFAFGGSPRGRGEWLRGDWLFGNADVVNSEKFQLPTFNSPAPNFLTAARPSSPGRGRES